MKYLIINGDDFGLVEGINRGIIQAYKEGILTSASLMANMPGFENAVQLLKENPNLGIGAHLNIVRGKPILSEKEIGSLTNNQGYFYDFSQVIKRLLLAQFDLREVEKEFRSQIKKILDYGLHITHLDTEKHIHIFLPILKILIRLCNEFKINKIRYFRKSLFFSAYFPTSIFKPYDKSLFLYYLSLINRRYLKQNNIKSSDYFYIIPSNIKGKLLTMTFVHILRCLKEGVTEIICHPGYFSNESEYQCLGFGKFNFSNREDQLLLLLCPELKQIFKRADVNPINYNQF